MPDSAKVIPSKLHDVSKSFLSAVIFHMFSCGCCHRVFYFSFSDAYGTRNRLHCHRKAFTSPWIHRAVLPNNGNRHQRWLHQHSSLTKFQRNVPVKSKLQHLPPPPGIPRTFDVFSCPVGREFDQLSLPGGGHLITSHWGWGI